MKKKTSIKLDKKTIITLISVVCGILLIVGLGIGIHFYKKAKADRTVRVAFYGLSDDIVNLIKAQIPQEEKIILEYDVISDGDFDTAVVKQKYDMLFTWHGEITDVLSKSAEDIPGRVLENIPSSLRDKKCLPIMLDHCELSFNTENLNKLKTDAPLTYDDFYDFLVASKDLVFSPFYCNGAEDRVLIDFIGAMVMAKSGLSAYNKLIDELRQSENLEQVLDVKLDEKGCSVRSILDILKTWPSQGLTHPTWYNGRGNDLLYFAEDKQLSCFFILLSEHRKISYNVIRNYETSQVPFSTDAGNYGLIAPAVSVMLLSDNSNCKRYVGALFTEDAQTELSERTGLAPVHYRAQAHDRQADDVRFWAASCAGGAVPDVYLAVYQRKTAALSKMAADIRSYLR